MDENKNYKFHEIMEFLENKNIEEGTVVVSNESKIKLKVASTSLGLSLVLKNGRSVAIAPLIINDTWKIKEALFYMKAPETFIRKYLIEYVNPETQRAYRDFVSSPDDTNEHGRTAFTKQEVEDFLYSYGDDFFIPEEVEDND